MNQQVPRNEFSSPESQLESAIEFVVAQPIDNEAINRVKNRAKDLQANPTPTVLNNSPELPETEATPIHHTVQPSKQTQTRFKHSFWMSAIAASLILAVGLTMLLSGKKTAFAKAIETLNGIKTLSFASETIFDSGETIADDTDIGPMKTRTFVSKDGRWRCEVDDYVLIADATGKGIMLNDSTKEANVLTQNEIENGDFNYLEWFARLKKCANKPTKELGKKTLSGHEVQGFVVEDPDELTKEVTVWIDTKSNHIVQIELEESDEDVVVKMIINDLKYDLPMEESLFDMRVPAGYTMEEEVVDYDSTQAFVTGLQQLVESLDGVFPQDLAKPKFDMTNEKAMAGFFAVNMFFHGLEKKDYQYTGAGKKRDGERSMVFWVRRNGKIHAVYNDLTLAEIAESDIPLADSK